MYSPKMKPYIRFIEIFISIMGHWPYQSTRTRQIIGAITGVSLISLSIPLGVCLYKARNDFEYFIECIPMAVTVLFVTWIVYLFLIIKKQRLLELLKHISDDFDKLQSFEIEFQILKKSAEEGRFVVFAYTVYTASSTCVYCGITLAPQLLNVLIPLNESRPRSYVSEVDYIFFDRDDHYFLTYLHTGIVGSYCVMLIVSYDALLYQLIQHACGMFRVLQYRLKNITEMITPNNPKHYTEKLEDDMLKDAVDCVRMYRSILKYTENIDSCFSICLLLCIGINIVLLSFQGAMMIMRLDEPEFVVRYGTYAFAQIIHLLYNSITGQKLVDHSNDVTKFIYEVQWYLASKKVQKILLIMMMRSLKESKVTIGKMFVLCLETYCSIMKTIFSYLSVLTSTRN